MKSSLLPLYFSYAFGNINSKSTDRAGNNKNNASALYEYGINRLIKKVEKTGEHVVRNFQNHRLTQ